LSFSGLTLAPGATVDLAYAAVPRYLSRPRPSGEARLNGVAISERVGVGDPNRAAACGCASGGELLAPALGLLALALRRRRLTARS
jgi:MYXO-CTERM domain-containing protein